MGGLFSSPSAPAPVPAPAPVADDKGPEGNQDRDTKRRKARGRNPFTSLLTGGSETGSKTLLGE